MEKLHFRLWLEDKESKQGRIRTLLDGQNLILFFTRGDSVFGAPEESRLVFAKMKSHDDDMPDGWADEANFLAFDLMQALAGQRVENMFGKKDLRKIKIIGPEDVEKMLMKGHASPKPADNLKTIGHSKHGAGMIKLRDKK